MADQDDTMLTTDLEGDGLTDSDLLLDPERLGDNKDNRILDDESKAIDEQEFSEPTGLKIDDDEEATLAKEYERGAGADADSEDIEALGFHVEEFSAADDSDDTDELDDFNALNSQGNSDL